MSGVKGAVEENEILEEDDAVQEIIDEEELGLLYRMKDFKKTYRAAFTELKQAKTLINQIETSID